MRETTRPRLKDSGLNQHPKNLAYHGSLLHRTTLLNVSACIGRPHPDLVGLASQLTPQLDTSATAAWLKLLTNLEAGASSFDDLVIEDGTNVVIALDVPVAAIDLFFRFRLVQLLRGLHELDTTLLVVLPPGDGPSTPRDFYRRAHGSWPFTRTLFVCPHAASAAAYAEQLGVPVEALEQEEIIRLALALGHGAHVNTRHPFFKSSALPEQTIAIQVQPMWGRCGSSTAFENELEALVEAGHFVIHVFVPDAAASMTDDTHLARYEQCRRETSAHVGAHAACFVAPQDPPTRLCYPNDDASHEFHAEIIARARFTPADCLVADAIRLATVAIVNHVTNLPLAIRLSPCARTILDTHDYFCRGAYSRGQLGKGHKAFASFRSLRRMLRTEVHLWKLADVCTAVSETELARIRIWQNASTIILPRPYVARVQMPAQNAAEYHALVVADQHPFNIRSLKWFLDEVWPYLEPQGLHLAVAGRAMDHIELSPYRNMAISFLGFVDDLEALRGRCLMTVSPDLHGTGIAIKALTVLATGHPLVATPVSLRGYDPKIVRKIPTHAEPDLLAADLANLAGSAEARAERIAVGDAVFSDLTSNSFASVLSPPTTAFRHTPRSRLNSVNDLLFEATDWLLNSRLAAEMTRLKACMDGLHRRPIKQESLHPH